MKRDNAAGVGAVHKVVGEAVKSLVEGLLIGAELARCEAVLRLQRPQELRNATRGGDEALRCFDANRRQRRHIIAARQNTDCYKRLVALL